MGTEQVARQGIRIWNRNYCYSECSMSLKLRLASSQANDKWAKISPIFDFRWSIYHYYRYQEKPMSRVMQEKAD